MKYPAKITPDEDGFIVEFPDLPGCLTQGDTIKEAQINAAEALSGYLASVNDREIEYNEPSSLTGNDIYLIPVDADVALAITVKKLRTEQHLTQKEIAAKMGVPYQIYQRIERGKKANLSINSLAKLERAFGVQLLNF